LAIEDELRLINLRIREHFLTKLFVLASFRGVRKSGKIRELVKFHSKNKYLLTAYSQKELRTLGKITANTEKKPFQELLKDYEAHLYLAFARTPSTGAYVNVLSKIMGYFSRQLSKDEKLFFIDSVEKYKAGSLPLSAVLSILGAWIVRFNQEYLSIQSILAPYPEQLTELESIFLRSPQKTNGKNQPSNIEK
jgi:uncharacterized protein YbgA (DUF1722 family)